MTTDLARPAPLLPDDCRQALRCLSAFALLLGALLLVAAGLITWLRMPVVPRFLPLGPEHQMVFGGDAPATALPLFLRALVTAGWLVLVGMCGLAGTRGGRWAKAGAT